MSLSLLEVLLPMLFSGLKVTIQVSVFGIILGTVIGSLTGYALQCTNKFVKFIADVYIWIIRATPLMVQALYAYYVIIPMLGLSMTSSQVGILVIALNSGAFISEIVRGALGGIDPGQKEAALSLGMSQLQTLIHVIVPPAFKSAMPALFNQFIISVKDTAILSVIIVNDITYMGKAYAALSFKTIPTYTVVAIFYLVFLSILIIMQKQIEKKMNQNKI